MHSANALFLDNGVPAGEGYLATLAGHYGTGVYPVDFGDAAVTKPAIDAWVNKNTGGRIEEAPARYDPNNTFSLLNSLYFAAAWDVPFECQRHVRLNRSPPPRATVEVPMMHSLQDMAYAEGPGWQACGPAVR